MTDVYVLQDLDGTEQCISNMKIIEAAAKALWGEYMKIDSCGYNEWNVFDENNSLVGQIFEYSKKG